VLPGDIGTEIAGLIGAAVAAGDLPAAAAAHPAAGTWRPAPPEAGGGPGTYATSLPFTLAAACRRDHRELAGWLADGLTAVPWVSAAQATGGGFVTVTVSTPCLAGVAARIAAAGPAAAAASEGLVGVTVTAPGLPDLAAARDWGLAWRGQRDALVGRLAGRAGAEVLALVTQRKRPRGSPSGPGPRPVAAAIADHGADAVRFALAATGTGDAGAIERRLCVPLDLRNPYVAVRYAHADATSTLRWAAALGLSGAEPGGQADQAGQPPEPESAELALLDAMSWLPERVAAAARRGRPAELAGYLDEVAGAWLDCREACPALPFGGRAAPAGPDGAQTAGRLGLAAAAAVTLAAGLALLGVHAPARM